MTLQLAPTLVTPAFNVGVWVLDRPRSTARGWNALWKSASGLEFGQWGAVAGHRACGIVGIRFPRFKALRRWQDDPGTLITFNDDGRCSALVHSMGAGKLARDTAHSTTARSTYTGNTSPEQ